MILDEGVFRTFVEHFLQANGRDLPRICLGDAHLAASEILITPGSHPWAGYTTAEDLQKRLEEPVPPAIAFELVSPTSFKLNDNVVETVPYPKLVFGSLAAAWRALSGEGMVAAVEKYAAAHLQPALHRALTLHNHPQLGSVGRVEYRFHQPEDTPLARALSLQADLAFYTGLGRKTAQGMGMARRIPVSQKEVS